MSAHTIRIHLHSLSFIAWTILAIPCTLAATGNDENSLITICNPVEGFILYLMPILPLMVLGGIIMFPFIIIAIVDSYRLGKYMRPVFHSLAEAIGRGERRPPHWSPEKSPMDNAPSIAALLPTICRKSPLDSLVDMETILQMQSTRLNFSFVKYRQCGWGVISGGFILFLLNILWALSNWSATDAPANLFYIVDFLFVNVLIFILAPLVSGILLLSIAAWGQNRIHKLRLEMTRGILAAGAVGDGAVGGGDEGGPTGR